MHSVCSIQVGPRRYVRKVADRDVGLERMAQVRVGIDVVSVPTSEAFMRDAAVRLEIGDDARDCARSDPHGVRDVALSKLGVLADRDEDVGVIGEKGPLRHLRLGIGQHHS